MPQESPMEWNAGHTVLVDEPYSIILTHSAGATLAQEIEKLNPSRLAVIVDSQTALHCYPQIQSFLPAHLYIEIPEGEINKNLDQCQRIWSELTTSGFDRKSLVVNLGGGMIGDLGGFAASAFKRGVSFIQLPTTLLSMVDAAVGGKTGIDFGGFKNQIGSFANPHAVIIAPVFLETLPQRQIVSGFAEIVKHTMLSAPQAFISLAGMTALPEEWSSWIQSSVQFKSEIVSKDPLEKGLRKLLNLGHTVGHAIESWSLEKHPDNPFLHGECVAAGLLCEARIAVQKGLMNEDEMMILSGFILDRFPKLNFTESEIQRMSLFALQDKKNEAGIIYCTLPVHIGYAQVDQEITVKNIADSLAYYSQLQWS